MGYIDNNGLTLIEFPGLILTPTLAKHAYKINEFYKTLKTKKIFRTMGANNSIGMVMKNAGNILIGNESDTTAELYVENSMSIGPTSTGNANLIIQHDLSNFPTTVSQNILIFEHDAGDMVSTPAVVLIKEGHVGVGLYPNGMLSETKGSLQLASGNINALSYNLPDGTSLGAAPANCLGECYC